MDWFGKNHCHVWAPYSAHNSERKLMQVSKAYGCNMVLSDGSTVLDGISGWWAMCHGYSHPYIIERMTEQLALVSHLAMCECVSEPAYNLAGRLADLTGMSKVLFTESGSSSTDAALKMSLQYHENIGNKGRNKFIYFNNGYHGETLASFGVSSVDWAISDSHNYCFNVPNNAAELQKLSDDIAAVAHEVAAVIIEPLVQCAGGMKFHTEAMLMGIGAIAKANSLLFIVDEIAVGFYRLGGSMFAFQSAGVNPDIVLLGKALSGGHCAGCGAVVVNEHVSRVFNDVAFRHGTTFMGNPLLCAAANASLDVFASSDVASRVDHIAAFLSTSMEAFRSLDFVCDVRVKGALGVIEFDKSVDCVSMRGSFLKLGVWLRPFSNVLYIMPPFIVSDYELTLMLEAAWGAVQEMKQLTH